MPRTSSRVVKTSDPDSLPLTIRTLRNGGIVILPTDTIYGVTTPALNYHSFKKLQNIRRPSRRPFIILIPDLTWLGKLGIVLRKDHLKLLMVPRMTFVFPRRSRLFHWIGVESLAVRYVREGFLYRVLKGIGEPLVAPSANREGLPPAESIEEAMDYFGEEVDLYVDGGTLRGRSSTLIDLKGEKPKVLRQGYYSPASVGKILRSLQPCRD